MEPVTLCLTIGKRPDLLKRTLESLLSNVEFHHVIAINDFRDEATNEMFRRICPNGQLISLDRQLGHHKAVDHMYQFISTAYVVHCEDDWVFDPSIDLGRAMQLLNANGNISQVCLRKVDDFHLKENERTQVFECRENEIDYSRLDGLHPQWHGYTFNPHLAKLETWKQLGGFAQFKKERHISRYLRSKGRFTAYINPGYCEHIGELQSVSQNDASSSKLRLLRKKIKRFFIGNTP
jgi:hypothetical protein